MNTEFDEKSKESSEAQEGEENYAFQNVMPTKDKEKKRTWSVASLIFSVLSVIFVYFSWAGLALGVLSIGAALLSRKNLGYFDKISLTGMIIAIFGIVFSIGWLAFGGLISSLFV